ncbi:MAG: ARMT1-like domain-containing protein [bacterium]|nr:ARMT1-like domain-containing protein [bacterium]
MKCYLECIPCFVKQAVEAGNILSASAKQREEILQKCLKLIINMDRDMTPPEAGMKIHSIIKFITGRKDPYQEIKDYYNNLGPAFYEKYKRKVKESEDGLLSSIRCAIAGNVVDFGVAGEFDAEKDIEKVMTQDFAYFDYDRFKKVLSGSRSILYLADNVPETFFDRILIEELKGKDIVYAVKSAPIINDATVEDALKAGIDKFAAVVESGSCAPGTVLSLCSSDFLETVKKSDMIISKGQGNYEALEDIGRKNVFFMLKAKCRVVSRHLNVKIGDIIFKANSD